MVIIALVYAIVIEYLTNSCTTSVMKGKKDILGSNLNRKHIFINYYITFKTE